MRIRISALATAFAFSTGALAQVDDDFMNSDAMELQRCVWRCHAEFGAASSHYGQCVEDLCSGKPKQKQSTAKMPRKAKAKLSKRRVIRNSRGDVLIRRVN